MATSLYDFKVRIRMSGKTESMRHITNRLDNTFAV